MLFCKILGPLDIQQMIAGYHSGYPVHGLIFSQNPTRYSDHCLGNKNLTAITRYRMYKYPALCPLLTVPVSGIQYPVP
jgi:hypothetical protein